MAAFGCHCWVEQGRNVDEHPGTVQDCTALHQVIAAINVFQRRRDDRGWTEWPVMPFQYWGSGEDRIDLRFITFVMRHIAPPSNEVVGLRWRSGQPLQESVVRIAGRDNDGCVKYGAVSQAHASHCVAVATNRCNRAVGPDRASRSDEGGQQGLGDLAASADWSANSAHVTHRMG